MSFLSFFSFASDRFRAELFKHAAILIRRDASSGGQGTHYTLRFMVWDTPPTGIVVLLNLHLFIGAFMKFLEALNVVVIK